MSADLTPTEEGVVMTRDYLNERMKVIHSVIAPKASPGQIEVFLHMCVVYDLDPFKGEIFLGPEGRPMTSRDGYRKIARRNPNFIACRSGVVYENDELDYEQEFIDGQLVIKSFRHKPNVFNRGRIVGAWAIGRVKGEPDDIKFAAFEQYRRGSTPWKTYPDAMIQKVAEVLVLRAVNEIAGIYTEEEMLDTERQRPNIIDTLAVPEPEAGALSPGERDKRVSEAEAELAPEQRTVNREVPAMEVEDVPDEPVAATPTRAEQVDEAAPRREPGDEFATVLRLQQLAKLADKDADIVTGAYGRFLMQLHENDPYLASLQESVASYIKTTDFQEAVQEHIIDANDGPKWLPEKFDTFARAYTTKGERAHLACIDVMQTAIYLLLKPDAQAEMVDVYVEIVVPFLDGFVRWMAATFITPEAKPNQPAEEDGDEDVDFDPDVQARKDQAADAAKIDPDDLPDPDGGDTFDGLFD